MQEAWCECFYAQVDGWVIYRCTWVETNYCVWLRDVVLDTKVGYTAC
jgi:hypothetical protein